MAVGIIIVPLNGLCSSALSQQLQCIVTQRMLLALQRLIQSGTFRSFHCRLMATHAASFKLPDEHGPLLVFTYGSLMWSLPAGVVCIAPPMAAQLNGYRRAFCVPSHTYRGSPALPGLVLGLEEAAGCSCTGVMLQLGLADTAAARKSLLAIDAQEMVADSDPAVYLRRWLPLTIAEDQQVRALCYVANPEATIDAATTLEDRAATIVRSHGQRGPNMDYLTQVATQLRAADVDDPGVEALMVATRAMVNTSGL